MTTIAVVAGTLASYALAWTLGSPVLVPVLNTLPALPVLVLRLRRGRVGPAVADMLAWAATMAVAATALSYWAPDATGQLFVHAETYRTEMFTWVRTGVGDENQPARFLVTHAWHAAAFCLLSLASGSVLSLAMGAVLMNYMGHYVGALASAGASPVPLAVLGWHPWSVVRIASYVVLGVVLGGPVLARVAGFAFRLRAQRAWLLAAALGLTADAVLKWLLAPRWGALLRDLAGW